MNQIKLTIFTVVAIVLFTIAGVANAQKIGFVNVSIVMKGAPQAKKAKDKLEAEFSNKDQELQDLEENVRTLKVELKKNSSDMKENKRTSLRKKIVKAQREFRTRRDEIRETFNIRQREELSQLHDMIYGIVIKLSKERKLDLVVSEPVLYAADKINLTEEVLSILKKQAK